MIINNNTDSEIINTGSDIINYSFNNNTDYVSNITKDNSNFILRHIYPRHYTPVMDAILNYLSSTRADSLADTVTEVVRPGTSGTDITKVDSVLSPLQTIIQNTSKSLFSPFSPDTLQDLNREILNAQQNLKFLEDTQTDPATKASLIEKALEESRYLLEQKTRHLEALQRTAAETPISPTDYDDLVENCRSLTNDVDSLAKKLENFSFRSIK
jgi:hypothetical protein